MKCSYRKRIQTSFGVLFFRATYTNIVDIYIDREPDSRTAFVWHTLHESLDGNTVTYAQHRRETVFAEEPIGLRAALNAFTDNQLRKLMAAVHDEARRRHRQSR